MSESKTPRTKAAELELIRNNPGLDEKRVMAAFDFARSIELELNEARVQLAKAGVEPFVGDYFLGQPTTTGILRSQLTTAQQEIAELTDALVSLRASVKDVLLPIINTKQPIQMWAPEAMQWSLSMEKTDKALSKYDSAMKGTK